VCAALSATEDCEPLFLPAPEPMSPINAFLLQHHLRIATNPCVSPDFCLDWPAVVERAKAGALRAYPKSRFATRMGEFTLLEDPATGDCAWRLETAGGAREAATVLGDGVALDERVACFPASFAN